MRRPEVLTIFATLLAAMLASGAVARDKSSDAETRGKISNTGQINLGLAQSYFQSNELKEALDRANLALRSDPESSDVHAMLGLIFNKIGDQPKAEKEFQHALALAPTDGGVLNAYGTYLCSRGKSDEADAAFVKAVQDPFYTIPAQALFNAGKCAHDAGQMPKAEAYLRRALEQAPDQGDILFMLANVELAQGKYLEARAFIQRREAVGGPDRAVLELGARIEDLAGDHAAAKKYRERIESLSNGANLPTGEGASQP
ncbi:MAG TPA: type IV pilus biogenesis/stability protein PilW [Arenimonas sp.]|uniref:type IV pilus biogenesis/stability protein PilW n=1 Tax=Arenimonas sp. TaxID=1872635 RepID=UPI002B78F084|nr:type IV pilus biogenesis/stability protein PilW [Arenimonas sp.]HMB57459.1 type IV pilus biogenesis/stability protein PilW [Arenimonas sp.]